MRRFDRTEGPGAGEPGAGVTVREVEAVIAGMRFSCADLPALARREDEDAQRALAVAQSLRRASGLGLPFAFDGFEVDSGHHFYGLNTRLVNGLSACVHLGSGGYHVRCVLDRPEGRHALIYRVVRETQGCVEHMGRTVSAERAFALASGLADPQGKGEAMAREFARCLSDLPCERMTCEGIEALYARFACISDDRDGADVVSEDSARRHAIATQLVRLVGDGSPSAHHPLMKALIALQMTLMLHPFAVANPFMARLLFAWAANDGGVPLVAYMPMMGFLRRWSMGGSGSDDSRLPQVSDKDAVVRGESGADWTLWFEETVDFLARELRGFAEKALGMHMRRERMAYLIGQDESLNARQRAVLLEALVHDDAEFTYAGLSERFDIAYATAYADLGRLEDLGYLRAEPKGKTTVFMAESQLRSRLHERLRTIAPDAYARFYGSDGRLLDERRRERTRAIEELIHSTPALRRLADFEWPRYNLARSKVILSSFEG
ncbi:hypothetical protein HLV38_02285 [Berryella wangjianweii]|uniref:Fido domain-containing protein n=1 Tax=Berryella wangjianweii TaxID=2734634 RepID=A0A6M8J0I3_9ACTN|nr:hypothetical protein [Berryella wangjianweii]QKF07087.1 hypothetical protein HLV38_02285 [Berryella wangjianweii]